MSKRWLLSSLSMGLKKSELEEMYLEMTGQVGANMQSYPSTKAGLLKELKDGRAAHWNRLHRRPASKGPQVARDLKGKVVADLCQITAAECNAFLRSLPPYEASK